MAAADPILPELRPDLEIALGPREFDGAPTYTVHDPLTRTYHRLGWQEHEVLKRLGPGVRLQALVANLRQATTLHLTAVEVGRLCQEAIRLGLTRLTAVKPVQVLLAVRQRSWGSRLLSLFVCLLYVRIPLIHPQRFLQRTCKWVNLLMSRRALWGYGLVAAVGIFLVLQQPGAYLHSFQAFYSWQGVLMYGVALTLVKLLHEFAHAYVATRFGVRVPTMGVALILFWPVPFCDVTDAWKLPDRTRRLLISAAGVITEVTVAGLALFLWTLMPPGPARSICFLFSSGSLLSTLFVNLNPGMRFDGYYIFSDLLGIDNLQRRAFAATRWGLYRTFLGLKEPPPVRIGSFGRLLRMMVYSVYAWAYRLSVYVGIAVLLYYRLAKIVGLFLFFVEMLFFVAAPIMREGRNLAGLRKRLRPNWRLVLTLIGVVLLFGWAVLPLPRRLGLPAVLAPEALHVVNAPAAGRITDMAVKEGDRVRAGQVLLRLASDAAAAQREILALEEACLVHEAQQIGRDPDKRPQLAAKQRQIDQVQAQRARLRQADLQRQVQAQTDGVVVQWNEGLHDGTYVRQDALLGRIADPKRLRVVAYVSEDHVADLRQGQEVVFLPGSRTIRLRGTVRLIESVPVARLDYLALTSLAHGTISVRRNARGHLEPVESLYRVSIELRGKPEQVGMGQSGTVWTVTSRSRSLLMDLLRHARRVVVRESGF